MLLNPFALEKAFDDMDGISMKDKIIMQCAFSSGLTVNPNKILEMRHTPFRTDMRVSTLEGEIALTIDDTGNIVAEYDPRKDTPEALNLLKDTTGDFEALIKDKLQDDPNKMKVN
jgi:hypothetical protein